MVIIVCGYYLSNLESLIWKWTFPNRFYYSHVKSESESTFILRNDHPFIEFHTIMWTLHMEKGLKIPWALIVHFHILLT